MRKKEPGQLKNHFGDGIRKLADDINGFREYRRKKNTVPVSPEKLEAFRRDPAAKKIRTKLFVVLASVVLVLVMVVSTTYAWLTMSKSPAVNGIEVSISGGQTILLAPDIRVESENGVVHYPGVFDSELRFSDSPSYDYLDALSSLRPVSTADGRTFFSATYRSDNGELNAKDAFFTDTAYNGANEANGGSYVYLDFWVVSPGNEYDLHVATDPTGAGGSYVIGIPDVEKDGDMFTLADPEGIAEASARIGFLVNSDTVTDSAAMTAYGRSAGYDSRYTSLVGVYPEKGGTFLPSAEYRFTVYEPNADFHPSMPELSGAYLETRPLRRDERTGEVSEESMAGMVTAQLRNRFAMSGEHTRLSEIFQTAVYGRSDLSAAQAASVFYRDYLQGQVGYYVQSGEFIKRTALLYNNMTNGQLSAEGVGALSKGGATEDVVITTLQRNVPRRIRMLIWIEGQDPDCTNANNVRSSALSVGLELSGASR